MNTRAMEIQDIAVISFLFLEKNRRIFERTSQNGMDALTLPLASPLGKDYKAHDGGVGI